MKAFSTLAAVMLMTAITTAQMPNGLTAVAGIKVGHAEMPGRPTGCTVVLIDGGAVAGVDVRGAAPGTRDTELLDPANLVDTIHAIAFAGGSAFGLDAAGGVMRFLEERRVGFPFGGSYVPIVPGAVIFDLPVGDNPRVRPDADCGYRAARAATAGPISEGSVGAGAGATVGKVAGMGRAMKGGVGTASFALPSGLIVAALVVVNPRGDVIDPSTGRVVAGVRTADGASFADARVLMRGATLAAGRPGENTTLAVVATNARLSKAQAKRIAMSGHDDFARAIAPAHTMVDGDAVFTIATGQFTGGVDLTQLGALAADVVSEAILRAVREAKGLPGLPSVREMLPK